jgi:hypothetical protein
MLEDGALFRMASDILHVVGDPKCGACKKSAPAPCKKDGCTGLVHEEEVADMDGVWTDRCCDLCGNPEEIRPPEIDLGVRHVDLPPMRSGQNEAKLEPRDSKRSANLQEAVIEEYFVKLEILAEQREEIDGKMNLRERAIRAMIEALAADSAADRSFLGKEEDWEKRLKRIVGAGSIGLTEAIRRVVWGKPPGMTARQVRDTVMLKYRILQGYSNPLAAVHTVLKRLCEGSDIEQTTRENGEIVYCVFPF